MGGMGGMGGMGREWCAGFTHRYRRSPDKSEDMKTPNTTRKKQIISMVEPRSRTAISVALMIARRAGMIDRARRGRRTRAILSNLSDSTNWFGATNSITKIDHPFSMTTRSRMFHPDLKYLHSCDIERCKRRRLKSVSGSGTPCAGEHLVGLLPESRINGGGGGRHVPVR
jgi:regulator of extracellular matrix RemA (YlzA/DUF370 family)